jgi:hypothetical protein
MLFFFYSICFLGALIHGLDLFILVSDLLIYLNIITNYDKPINILKFLIREIVYLMFRLNIIKPLYMGTKKRNILVASFYFCFNFLRAAILINYYILKMIYYYTILPIKDLLKRLGTWLKFWLKRLMTVIDSWWIKLDRDLYLKIYKYYYYPSVFIWWLGFTFHLFPTSIHFYLYLWLPMWLLVNLYHIGSFRFRVKRRESKPKYIIKCIIIMFKYNVLYIISMLMVFYVMDNLTGNVWSW